MFRVMKAGIVVAAAVALAACSSTSFQSTWSAPDAGPLKLEEGTKVIAFFPSSNTAQRRGLEAALAKELNSHGLDATAAYQVVPEDLDLGEGKAKPYIERAGAAYVLVMQVTGKDKQVTGTPSMWGGGFYGYGWGGWGGWGWGGGTDIRTDTLVGVETLLYDVKADKLVWAGQSQTMNPSKADSFARELVRAVGDELRKDGLITAPRK